MTAVDWAAVIAFAGVGTGLAVLAWWLLSAVEDLDWDDDTEAEDRLTGGGW